MSADEAVSTHWVKGILRSEMAKKGVTYSLLTQRLKSIGVDEDEKNLANKVGRGTFSAVLLLQCLSALNINTLTFTKWQEYNNDDIIERLELVELSRKSREDGNEDGKVFPMSRELKRKIADRRRRKSLERSER